MRSPLGPGRRFRNIGARLTPAVMWIIGAHVAAFLFYALSGRSVQAAIVEWLVLTPRSLVQGHVWKVVTTAFFTVNGLTFLLNVLVLWFFMPVLERAWGRRRFLIFALAATVAANVAGALFGLLLGGRYVEFPLLGLTPFILAGIIGYGTAFAEQPVSFFGVLPLKAKTLAIGIAALAIVGVVVNASWVEAAAQITAMITGWALTTDRLTPRIWLLKWRRDRLRRRYTVLDGGAGPGKVGGASGRARKPEKKWLN